MVNLILAIQGALMGLLGSAGTDGSGCPLPNSTNFYESGWNGTVAVGTDESASTEQGEIKPGCPVFIDLENLQSGCMRYEDVANLTAQDLYPRLTGNAFEVWVDDQQLPFTGAAEDLGSDEADQSDPFCGNSISIHMEKELDVSDSNQDSDEVIRRQARAPVDQIRAPILWPPRPRTAAPTPRRWWPWPPRTEPPTWNWNRPTPRWWAPTPRWNWPTWPWPPRPDPGPVWQEQGPFGRG